MLPRIHLRRANIEIQLQVKLVVFIREVIEALGLTKEAWAYCESGMTPILSSSRKKIQP
jgi:hypothetical protein